MPAEMIARKIEDLRPVLMDPAACGPDIIYYVLRFRHSTFGPEPNITIIPPARLGREYPKTFGHYHRNNEGEKYRVLYGRALILQQKQKRATEEISEVKVVVAAVGEEIEVLPGWGHCLINTTDDLLITADWESETAGHFYEPVLEKHGMAYYFVEKDEKPEAVPNGRYEKLPLLEGWTGI